MSIADKLTTIAENMQRVYDAGKAASGGEGDSFYDTFWDAYQSNGNKVDYDRAFNSSAWKDASFQPKYDIKPTRALETFAHSGIKTSEYLKKLDFSQCVYCGSTFASSQIEELGVIDISSVVSGWGFTGMFTNATKLRKIERFVFPKDSKTAYNYPFQGCVSLTDITIGGTIYKTLSFQWCPLNKASIVSIIGALSDAASSQTLTLKQTAVNTAFETVEGAADGSTTDEWLSLIATKSNWTISLA